VGVADLKIGNASQIIFCYLLRNRTDRGAKESPQSMDEMFHRMVWKGLQ